MSSSEAPLLGTLCCVPNCINSYGNRGLAQFYYFPVNPQLCEIWKSRINNVNIMHLSGEQLREVQICDLHFETANKSKWGLQKSSLPTLGLPGFSETSHSVNFIDVTRLQLTINNLQSICRICYCQDDLYDISTSKYQNMTIEHIFNNITNDKYISNNSFPGNICLSCIKLLIQTKLFLEQTHNAATLFQQLLTQDQNCINVITADFERNFDENKRLCQLQHKHDFSNDSDVKNQNNEHFASVYLPNSVNVKIDYLNKNVNYSSNKKNPLEDSFVNQINDNINASQVDQIQTDTNKPQQEISENDNSNIEKQSNNDTLVNLSPIIMTYSTFVRTTRRSSNVSIQSHKHLDTNSGPVVISYLTEEGSNKLNPSSVQLPTSSGRFSGVVHVPAIDIRCNMDLDKEGQNKHHTHFLESSSSDINDISQILEVKVDLDKTTEKSKNNKIYRCELCNEEFADKFVYKRHKKEHNAKKFMCTICQATFNTGTECSKHKMSHTRTCEVCGKSIQRKCYLNHLKTHDEGHAERYEQVKIKAHKLCNKCGRVFKRRWAFHAPCHTSAAPGKFQCDQCPFRTHYHKTLKQHLLVHAPAGDQFVCATCGDCFGTEDVLNKHMKLQHSRSAKLYPCKWCSSKFETRYERTKHLTTDHGKKPLKEYHHPPTKFKCNYCSMTFVTADNLRLHLWSHPNATDAELELNNPSTSKAKRK